MLCIVVGTRPEIIKMSPVIRAGLAEGRRFHVVHTGQHYSHAMDAVFFDDLDLPAPDVNLGVGSGSHGAQTGRMLVELETTIQDLDASAVVVQGDTNTVAAGSLAAAKLRVPVCHVEAGLRSYERSMPEELNRVVADHLSDRLFAPTEGAAANLAREGLDENVVVTGNTVVDAVQSHISMARKRSSVLDDLGLAPKAFLLLTAHRPENVDDSSRLRSLLSGVDRASAELGFPVVFPIHPRTLARIEHEGVEVPPSIRTIDPVGYFDFLVLIDEAVLVMTDSGGIQEEACVLGVPLVTLRDNTERPEAVEVGASMLVGVEPEQIVTGVHSMVGRSGWSNPFGDGSAGVSIAQILSDDGYW